MSNESKVMDIRTAALEAVGWTEKLEQAAWEPSREHPGQELRGVWMGWLRSWRTYELAMLVTLLEAQEGVQVVFRCEQAFLIQRRPQGGVSGPTAPLGDGEEDGGG